MGRKWEKGVGGIGYSQTCELYYHNYRITIFLGQGAERNYLNRVEYGSIVIRPWEGGGSWATPPAPPLWKRIKIETGVWGSVPAAERFPF